MLRGFFVGSVVVAACAVAAACGGGKSEGGFTAGDAGSDGTGGGSSDAPGSFVNDGSQTFPDGGSPGQESGTGTQVAVVYAHSADTLYRMDATSKQIAVVGAFSGGCSSGGGVIDIAIDSASDAYVTTSSDLWKLDLQSAACTHIASGSYPNSLSFVPKGTLDPNAEAMVGYNGSEYIHINTTTGAVTSVGSLSGGYSSSGDIVSVIGGGTFLTVKGPSCSDCLLQIDPKTGDLVQSYGSVNHSDVFGLAFWAGTAYGFDNGGQVFSISWQSNKLVTTPITVPNPPPGLSFWGAGSTTSAPPTSADGGGIPIQ
jgi:hypothetical protein